MKKNIFLTGLSIRARLTASISILTVFSLILCGSCIYPLVHRIVQDNIEKELHNTTRAMVNMVQAAVNVSVRSHLRAIAEKNLEIVSLIYEEYQSGKISEDEAKQRAERILLGQTIGKTGYLYCLNSNGNVAIHPRSQVKGTNISDHEFIREQTALKNGYINYEWNNPGEKEKKAKALFMSYFAPWDWIISVSAYKNEFSYLINADDFREKVMEISLGKSGYVFIIGKDEEIIVHPWVKGSMKEFYDTLGYQFLHDIYKQKNGKIAYRWQSPDSSEPRKKIAVFEELPQLGWIVASSVYTDEIYGPLNKIITFICLSIAIALLLAIPLGAVVSDSITTPVRRLAELFAEAAKGNWGVRSAHDSRDEIGTLSQGFNRFMDDLQGMKSDLNTEVEIRQKSEYRRRLFEEVFKNAMEGICITDTEGKIIATNPAFTAITGYRQEEILGRNPKILKSDKHSNEFYERMWTQIREKGHWTGEIWNRRKTGESYPELLSISAIRDADGAPTHYVSVFHDITEMKSKEEQLKYQAHHDALTGLPNRILLIDRIAMAISRAKRHETRLALFYLDLDNFKNVNDSLGHETGDRILIQTTERLKQIFKPQDTLARLGGDEFVIMIEGIASELDLITRIEKLLSSFARPFSIDETTLHVTTSLGITIFPDDGEDAGTLIKNADMAMYQAKEEGRNGYHMFRQEMNERAKRRLTVENALRRAVADREFSVYYQPKTDLETATVYGLEALVRWIRPDGIVISPGEFIPLAEETGLIIDIGRIVLETACKDLPVISNKTGLPLSVSINLSGRQLDDPEILNDIRSTVQNTGCNPGNIEFEITESTLMDDVKGTVELLEQISEMGFSLSIDDFGTGYSSLAYLKRFPINTLKIDRSFVMDITESEEDTSIVQTIIDMSRNLGLDVVAEGVEKPEQSAKLLSLGCSRIQGFLYGKPMPLQELIEHLNN
ncbi:EAL domain-containing protein [Maridesulfovibrio sp.]|uniref:bifunctional diguanylate cyclase/phosphodiesterase n=1 Tax=Maridesulfovibrio sp. TaxID=2795000 RepID=UPI002A18B44E|nr:EAL domain-containing protein [Maridesulfovibrio sp.]